MPSSLFRVVVKQPELLLDHAQAYAELFESELSSLAAVYGRSARLNTAMLSCLIIGSTLLGVAILLAAAVPQLGVYAACTLGIVPILPFVVAYGCHRLLQDPVAAPFEVLRHQIHADIRVLRAQAQS
jgi:hypothetical protein